MKWLEQILQNKFIINGIVAWAIAQVAKTILHAVIHKKIEWPRLVGGGGMPSSHSATVTAIATTCAVLRGLDSFEFGVTVILALIVMHDAMNVRFETGKQAKVLNQVIDFAESLGRAITPEQKLKEFVGHTPAQVFVGGVLGIVVGLLLT
ncbi:MAG TPA: divergent PAP2 family protein [Papillibacter sp.]|jgi:acid phosphatase family membrane protein YuiD|nr:divergent PAP2 family protein [Papillibacter sp.]